MGKVFKRLKHLFCNKDIHTFKTDINDVNHNIFI